MQVLIPYPITTAELASSNVPEPAEGETVWASGGSYSAGDLRISTSTHRVYKCASTHSGRSTPPEADFYYWQDMGPTQRWAMFDNQISTQSSALTTLTVVLRPGFVNAVGLYGVAAAHATITLKDAPGGATIKTVTQLMQEPPIDWYDWAFGRIRPLGKILVTDLTPHLNAEITITLSADTGTYAKCGMVIMGNLRDLVDSAHWGGTEYGATAEPVDYSYIKTNEFGDTTIIKRRNVTDMSCRISLPRALADSALNTIQEVMGTPAAWVATQAPGYAGLNVFGLGSASISYDSFSNASINLRVKALV